MQQDDPGAGIVGSVTKETNELQRALVDFPEGGHRSRVAGGGFRSSKTRSFRTLMCVTRTGCKDGSIRRDGHENLS